MALAISGGEAGTLRLENKLELCFLDKQRLCISFEPPAWVYALKILDFGGVIHSLATFAFSVGCVAVEIEHGTVVTGMKGDLAHAY